MKVELSRYTINGISGHGKTSGVVYNGMDNLFPDYLDGLFNKSVTHRSIINDVVGYIVGYGLKAPMSEEKLKEFFPKREQKKVLKYKRIHNAVALELIKNSLGDVIEMNVLNPSQVRVSEMTDGKPSKFIWRKSWDRKKKDYKVTKEFDAISDDVMEGLYYWYDNGTFDVPYGRPEYLAGLDPIELEIAIYMMHNHGAQNGMFPSMVIAKESSNNPKDDQEDTINTQAQVVGPANAGKIVTVYYPPGGNAPVFSTPNLTGLDKIYENQYVVAESGILKAHGIPSPSLIAGLNVKPTGFASPEDEMQWAKNELMHKQVLPEREEFMEIMQPIFDMIGITGAEFEDVENDNNTIQLSKANHDIIVELGETEEDMEGWELIDEREVDYDLESALDEQIKELNKGAVNLASTGTARPNAKSEQDKFVNGYQYKTRYVYSGDATGEREFCRKMLAANKLYRKEDIEQMSQQAVNPGFGPKGTDTYDIFKFHGGIYCHHKWLRRTYRKEGAKGSIDVTNPNAETISTNQAQRNGYRVDNPSEVATKTIDQPDRGRYTFSKFGKKLNEIMNYKI